MSSNPSQGQRQQPGQGNILSPGSGKGGEGKPQERGDNNRSPRQEQQAPGRPPQRQQSDASRRAALDEDEDALDTQPNPALGVDTTSHP